MLSRGPLRAVAHNGEGGVDPVQFAATVPADMRITHIDELKGHIFRSMTTRACTVHGDLVLFSAEVSLSQVGPVALVAY